MSRRRVSLMDQTSTLLSAVREKQEVLKEIWDRVGFDEEERETRTAQVYGHLSQLLDDMVQEEADMEAELRHEAEAAEEGVNTLQAQLGIDPTSVMDDSLNLNLLVRARRATQRLLELKTLQSERLKRLGDLRERDEEATTALGAPRFHLRQAQMEAPSEATLVALTAHVAAAEREVAVREQKVVGGRDQVAAIRRLLPASVVLESEAEFEQDLMASAENRAAFPLSSSNMHSLEVLLERLEGALVTYREEMAARFDAAVGKLERAWEQCLVPAKSRMALPQPGREGIYGEEAVLAVEAETDRWERYYAEREAVLRRVSAWERLWEEKLEAERPKEGDTKRYNNRGGQLEKALKRQRQVETLLLPRAEADLSEMMQQWRASHPGEKVGLDGMDPLDHIHQTKADYEEQKAAEKAEREARKKAGINDDSTRGRLLSKRTHSPLPRAANRAHFVPGAGNRTPIKTVTGLLVTSTATTPRPSPLGVSKSASKLHQPVSSRFLEPRTPKMRKMDYGGSTGRLGTPTSATNRVLRCATSVANLAHASPTALRGRPTPRVNPRGPLTSLLWLKEECSTLVVGLAGAGAVGVGAELGDAEQRARHCRPSPLHNRQNLWIP